MREVPNLHPEIFLRDVTDGTQSPCIWNKFNVVAITLLDVFWHTVWFDGDSISMRLGSSIVFSTHQTTSEFFLRAKEMIWTHWWRGGTDCESSQDEFRYGWCAEFHSCLELSDAVQIFAVSRTRENRYSEIEVLLGVMQEVPDLHNFYGCVHDMPLSLPGSFCPYASLVQKDFEHGSRH